MACSGVSYTVGREANAQYGETYNGAQRMDGHQFPDGIDPYVVKGDSTSGLLYGINPDPIVPDGEENKKVQAYNFRITLTNRPENRVEITKPDNYDPQRYELLIRLKEKQPWKAPYDVFIWSRMPNGKTDINNFGGFSTDVIGENWNYPEAGYEERDSIRKFHEDYTKGLLYFVGHDPRIPDSIRQEMLQWGYPKDEYTDNGHWTHQMYVREARRMIGATVMTQHHCEGRETATDGIAWAAYTMDSHNCDRHVINGMVKNEGNVEIGGFGPYPISYRAITPRAEEVGNLLVPVCLSASHIAYGSIRMEPVFMVLGQVSAIGACQAIDGYGNRIQKVGAEAINDEFTKNPLADGSQPELFIDNNDTENVAVCGTWKTETNVWSAYGPDFLSDDSKGASPKSLKYMPQIPVETEYDIYAYFPKVNNLTTRTLINVCDGKQQHERVIESADIVVEGQTGGEWVSIGRYKLPEGRESYVEISNKGADGIVVADAVLFIPARP